MPTGVITTWYRSTRNRPRPALTQERRERQIVQFGVRHDDQPRLSREEPGCLDRGDEIAVQLPERRAPQ